MKNSLRLTRFFSVITFLLCLALLYNILIPEQARVYVIPTVTILVFFLFSACMGLLYYCSWLQECLAESENRESESEQEIHRLTYENQHLNEKHKRVAEVLAEAMKRSSDKAKSEFNKSTDTPQP